jgi:hypothetical protein
MNNRIGPTRYKLAELVSRATGALFEAHAFEQNHPRDRYYRDCCAWSAWGVRAGGVAVHVYSWDSMKQCVKNGVQLVQQHGPLSEEWEICANDD